MLHIAKCYELQLAFLPRANMLSVFLERRRYECCDNGGRCNKCLSHGKQLEIIGKYRVGNSSMEMTVFPLGSFGNHVSNGIPGRILSAGITVDQEVIKNGGATSVYGIYSN